MADVVQKIEKKLKREPAWVWYLGAGGSLAAIIALVVALHRNNATAGAAQAASSPGATSLGGSNLAPTPVSAGPVSTTTITDTTDTYAPVSTVTTTTSGVDSHNFQQSFGNINGAGTGDCPTCGPAQVPAIPNTDLPSFGGEGLTVDELRSKISALSANYAQDVASGNPAAASEAHTQAEFLRAQAATQGLGKLQPSKYGYEQLATASGVI